MSTILFKQISEFFTAAKKPYSYNILDNSYIWFGILWGMPIPLVTALLEYRYLKIAATDLSWLTILQSPIQWLFMVHPLLFGVVFGIMGTIKFEKEQELDKTIRQLKEISIIDPLTGLKNRRYFAHNFHDECARSLRRKEPLSLLFLDIDHFKKINDTYGHHYGDMVLKELGGYLKKQCRPYDTPVRWGGEEFLVLLRATDETSGTLFAERIRLGIESNFSPIIQFPVSISIGLAQYRLNDTLEDLTDRADRALYHAKQTGRNRVISWSTIQSTVQ